MARTADKSTPYPKMAGFRRAIEASDVLLRAGAAGTDYLTGDTPWVHGQRTTQSYGEISEAKKQERATKAAKDGKDPSEEIKTNNLVGGERAQLPTGESTLHARWSLNIGAIDPTPDSCPSAHWYAVASAYRPKREDLEILAGIYGYHLANGAWLWRNRDEAMDGSVHIEAYDFEERKVIHRFEFKDVLDRPLRAHSRKSSAWQEQIADDQEFAALVHLLTDLFDGAGKRRIGLRIEARLEMLPGQAVWPSQRFVHDKKETKEKGRQFYRVDNHLAITAEKALNALRHGDIWHDDQNLAEAIPFEPRGGYLKVQENLRNGKSTLMQVLWPTLAGDHDAPEHQATRIFVLGCLARGFVYTPEGEIDTTNE